MIKKGTALCVATFVLAGCGKDHVQGQFNRNEKCSVEYLELLKKECSDQVTKWIDTNKDLLLKLEIWKVDKIIIPDQNSKYTNDIETRYKEISERPNAKFFGGEPLRITLEEIGNNFDNNWEKNASIFSDKLSKYVQFAGKVSLDVPDDVRNFLKTFKEQEEVFIKDIDCKISAIRFEYVADEDKKLLFDRIKDCIEGFRHFCELGNFEESKDIDFEQLVSIFKNQKKSLEKKISESWVDGRKCFIEMISRKIDNFPQVLKDSLEKMDYEIIEDEFAKFENFEKLTPDDIAMLIRNVNLSRLAPGNFSVLKKIQDVLNFNIEWHDEKGLKLKSNFAEIFLTNEQCGIKKIEKWNGIVFIMDVDSTSVILNKLIAYIHDCNVFKKNIPKDGVAGGLCSVFYFDSEGNLSLNSENEVKFKDFSVGGKDLKTFLENCYKKVLFKVKK